MLDTVRSSSEAQRPRHGPCMNPLTRMHHRVQCGALIGVVHRGRTWGALGVHKAPSPVGTGVREMPGAACRPRGAGGPAGRCIFATAPNRPGPLVRVRGCRAPAPLRSRALICCQTAMSRAALGHPGDPPPAKAARGSPRGLVGPD